MRAAVRRGGGYQVYDGPRRPFSRGDKVRVVCREGRTIGRVRVTKVTKKHVTTDCGRQWTLRGWYQGERQAWPFPTIRRCIKEGACNTRDGRMDDGDGLAEVWAKTQNIEEQGRVATVDDFAVGDRVQNMATRHCPTGVVVAIEPYAAAGICVIVEFPPSVKSRVT